MKTFKKTLCLVLVAVMALGIFATAASAKSLSDYNDAKDVNSQYKVAVDFDTQLGVLRGTSETTYKPQGTLIRAQLATMIYRITKGDVTDKYLSNYKNGTTFSDVKPSDWFAGYVNWSADNQYLIGVGGDKYSPNNALTGYQTMAALLRTLGYDANGEFKGKDWTKAVTKAANDSGISDGIVADWAKPVTREVAAQLVMNTLFANKVRYTNAFGYTEVYPRATIAENLFKIASPKEGEVDHDKYGNPLRVWKDIYGKVVVSMEEASVLTYTKGVTMCDLLVDLGIAKTDTSRIVATTYRNAAGNVQNMTWRHDPDNHCGELVIGGNGVLTNVYTNGYDNRGRLRVTVSETAFWLGQIDSFTTNTHGVAASSSATVFGPAPGGAFDPTHYETGKVLDTTAYAVKSFVLTTKGDGMYTPYNNKYTVTGTPTTSVGKLTSVTDNLIWGGLNSKVLNIDGKNYELSYNFAIIGLGTGDVKTLVGETLTFFFDAYGYIIGVAPYIAPQTYGIIDRIYFQSGSLTENGKAAARVVYMDGKTADVTISTINGYPVYDGTFTLVRPGGVAQDPSNNDVYCHIMYNVTSGAIVEQKLLKVNKITKGSPVLSDKDADKEFAYSMDTTVFLYKTYKADGTPEYNSYVGYKNAPTTEPGARIWVTKKPAVVSAKGQNFYNYVFVDALGGMPNSSSGKYIVTKDTKTSQYTVDLGAPYGVWTYLNYSVYTPKGEAATVTSNAAYNPYLFGDPVVPGIYKVSFTSGVGANATSELTASNSFVIDDDDVINGTTVIQTNPGENDDKAFALDGKSVYIVDKDVVLKEANSQDVKDAFKVGNTFVSYDGAFYIFVK